MAPLIIGPSPQAITTQNNRGDTLVHAIIRYNDMALLQYIIEKHKTYVQTALDIKNNALESPRDMVTKLRRVQMSPLLDGISTLRGKSNRTPPVPTATK